MIRRSLIIIVCLLLPACAGAKHSQWDDIDYSRLREHEARENDTIYTAPSGVGCIEDYLCH